MSTNGVTEYENCKAIPRYIFVNREIYDLTRINGLRAPAYFRPDFRFDRTFTVREKPLLFWVGIQNVIDRRNVTGVRWNQNTNRSESYRQEGLFLSSGSTGNSNDPHMSLIVKNIIRNKRRTILTIVSIAASLCQLGMLMALYRSFFHSEASQQQAHR